MKQKKLSPKQYIETKARTLPVYKCLVSEGWNEYKMATVIVMCKHVTGNITAGIYLIDLMCLGVKDTFYFFNSPEEEVMERLEYVTATLTEIDYNLAHNIIYAGHDFAAEYGIDPHKEWNTTRYILEEDDEKIPLIEIPTGDKDGKPHLMVDRDFNYIPVLEKLKRNAGEGNYTFTLADSFEEDDDDFEEDEDFDDEEFDEFEDVTEEENSEDIEYPDEEEMEELIFADDDEDEIFGLEDIEPNQVDFNNIRDLSTEELEAADSDFFRSMSDEAVIDTELMLRSFYERNPELQSSYGKIVSEPEFIAYEEKKSLHEEDYERSQSLIENAFEDMKSLEQNEPDAERRTEKYRRLFESYAKNEIAGSMVLMGMPLFNLTLNLEYLKESMHRYPPFLQLVIMGYSMSLQATLEEPDSRFNFVLNASSPAEAFPGKLLHALHYKLFWVVKSLDALWKKDKVKFAYYHSFLTITGIGGTLKHMYAVFLAKVLEDWW